MFKRRRGKCSSGRCLRRRRAVKRYGGYVSLQPHRFARHYREPYAAIGHGGGGVGPTGPPPVATASLLTTPLSFEEKSIVPWYNDPLRMRQYYDSVRPGHRGRLLIDGPVAVARDLMPAFNRAAARAAAYTYEQLPELGGLVRDIVLANLFE